MINQVAYVFNGEQLTFERGDHTPIVPSYGDIIQLKGSNYEVKTFLHKFESDNNNEIFLHRVIVILEEYHNVCC